VRRSNRRGFFKSPKSYAQTTAHGSTLPADSFPVRDGQAWSSQRRFGQHLARSVRTSVDRDLYPLPITSRRRNRFEELCS
jgi:hypothetical protein